MKNNHHLKAPDLEKLNPGTPLLDEDTDFQIVAEDAPVMLWLTNAEGKVVFTNLKWKKFVGATTDGNLSGNAWLMALHPDERENCLAIFNDAFVSHQPFEMEYRLRRFDGQYRYILDTGEPYINKEGKFSGYIGSSADITERKNYENKLRHSQMELTQHNREMALINELNSYLQVCRSLQETHAIVHYYAKQIFTDQSGALYLFDENHGMVEAVAMWGDKSFFSAPVISPDDCWALRQGRLHVVEEPGNAIRCSHIDGQAVQGYVCAPAIAQGEMIGFLCVTLGDGGDEKHPAWASVESRTRLISLAADNLAMALVSLKLREALRNRSLHDPMTQLFNRRYLDDTLIHELANCQRLNRPLGVIMIDIDHFKSYNDTHGHDAGDYVLIEIAELMRSKLREGDVACRYGGEELVMIILGASKQITLDRAEMVRDAIEKHGFIFKGKNLAGVTASLGVAAFPEDGNTAAGLLKAADTALYQAKESGRNQVVASSRGA
ncbi:sensor domain-containing diguanylate cyclase [Methylovulum miyakonense]|uniref:sensor domain-containing diguanylate cyclase n=1 Tax=Methylovulum miyakonense TaxID=645578 RepID=UPI000382F262|nr:GGDEF domain-containing protein [Methylovulum miyakonense]